jgi:hypothetical protein
VKLRSLPDRAAEPAPPTRLVPRWVGIGLAAAAVILAPWTAWILIELPDRHVAHNWSVAWGGFDIRLALALAATGLSVLRRARTTAIAASAAATMLVCDAWFDVVTSHGGKAVGMALVQAALAELPLAAVCFWIAIHVDVVLGDTRPTLERAGLRASGRERASGEARDARA